MIDKDAKRFVFNGHAVGTGAHFDRLDEHRNLNITVPTLGASVLPVTGGLSHATASNFLYAVHEPVKRQLLSVGFVETKAHGHMNGSIYQTDISTRVERSTWVERVHFGLLALNMQTTHHGADGGPTILIRDLQIKALELGSVTAEVELDEEPFASCGTKESIDDFWARQSDTYRRENATRFPVDPNDPTKLVMHRGYYPCSVVRSVRLSGPARELRDMKVEGHTITWDDPKDHKVGFGKIILGEVLISGDQRRITLARLQMGCPTGGSGSGGEGQSNGGPSK